MNIRSSKHLSPKTCTEGVLTISNETVPPGGCYKSYVTAVIFLANKQIVWREPVPNKETHTSWFTISSPSPFHHFTITTSGSLTTPQPVVQKEFAPASQKQPVPWWRIMTSQIERIMFEGIWLMVRTPSEKYTQVNLDHFPRDRGKNKHVWNHHLGMSWKEPSFWDTLQIGFNNNLI